MQLPQSISAEIEAGGLVVASSARAARALRKRYGESQRERGLTAWQTPEILHWDGWLEKLWRQEQRTGSESRLLLSAMQEHGIWVRLVKPEIEGQRLISIDGVADLAQEAYALICAYRAFDFLRAEVFGNTDIESFRQWARAFERECREQGWLSRSMLPLALGDALARGGRFLPRRVALIGFDRITPAQQSLIDACGETGCRVQLAEKEPPLTPAEALVAVANPKDEISLCAWWARRTLEEAGLQGKKVQLAVLVPEVNSARSEIERIFRQILAPASISVAAPESPLPFEFSLGSPLARIPMVRAALLLLRWVREGLPQEELTWLMLSGFLWQEESDLLSLSEFDAALRRKGILLPEQEMGSYLRGPGWHESPARSKLRDRLHAARRAVRVERGATAGFATWVERIQATLSAAGWPGARRLASEDFQVRTKWEQLLDGISAMTLAEPPVPYGEFLHVLRREAERTIFSPESRDAAIQILGPFEAAGMQFDAIWFLGADDTSWPAAARPHPFLTQNLQKQQGMPHADNSADWELAKLVTQRIQSGTSRCIFSYAVQGKDGKRRPSTALIATSSVICGTEMREILARGDTGFAALLDDGREFPPLAVEEEPGSGIVWQDERSPGGQEVLKKQAACPFQAFAHFRLGARELDAADWGLDPMERGNLLHKALQWIWDELKDRDCLIKAGIDGNLHEIIERHVDRALAKHADGRTGKDRAKNEEGRPEESWSRAYLQAERERVVRLVEEWLSHEEQRPPFQVEEVEKDLIARVGDLDLNLRADRIDKVAGGRLLIDYKTGIVKSSAWTGDRPDEPQLPLYATYGNVTELRGALLARIRSGDLKLDGSVSDPRLLMGKSRFPPYTPQLRQQWEQVLLTLSRQFHEGNAQVDPKRRTETCKLCALPGLCRVAATRNARMGSETSEDEGGNGEE